MSHTPAPWHNLLAYPDLDIDELSERSLFWQIESHHPFYMLKQNGKGKGISAANFFHEPIILKSGFWGNRVYLEPERNFRIGMTYTSSVRFYLALYQYGNPTPTLFWVLDPADEPCEWEVEFEIKKDLSPKLPFHIKLIIPDTKGGEVTAKGIFICDTVSEPLPEVTVGIVTYNRKDYLAILLEQIAEIAYPSEKIKVVVVNNASVDGTDAMLASRFPHVTVLRNKENVGGAGGFNTFFKYIMNQENRSPLAWLIDDDAQIDRYTLIHLVRVLLENEAVTVAGSVMMDLEHPSVVYESGGTLYHDRFGWKANILHREARELHHIIDMERVWEVGYAGAYSFAFRTNLLDKVGIWRDYFLHVDDSEWCHRVQKLTGKKVVISNDSLIWHVLQGARKPFTFLRYYETRNFLDFFSVYSGKKAAMKVLLQCIVMGIRQLIIKRRDLFSFHVSGIEDFFEGHFGKREMKRSAIGAKDMKAVFAEYEAVKNKKPEAVFLVREINHYVNDGIDYEAKIAAEIREISPQTKIVEVSLHWDGGTPRLGDAFLHLTYSRRKILKFFKQIWKVFFHAEGIVLLPFWNEAIVPNNLACLTAVYEDKQFSLYWTDRKALLKSLFHVGKRVVSWSSKILLKPYNTSASSGK